MSDEDKLRMLTKEKIIQAVPPTLSMAESITSDASSVSSALHNAGEIGIGLILRALPSQT